MTDQVLLRDLVAIPNTVHDGDFVLTLARGIQDKSTITDYVVTEPLALCIPAEELSRAGMTACGMILW